MKIDIKHLRYIEITASKASVQKHGRTSFIKKLFIALDEKGYKAITLPEMTSPHLENIDGHQFPYYVKEIKDDELEKIFLFTAIAIPKGYDYARTNPIEGGE